VNALNAHPSAPRSALRLYGRRVMLRPLVTPDWEAWAEVRRRNHEWLTVWEPSRPVGLPDPVHHKDAFAARCSARDRERQMGSAYAFGLFVDNAFAGEVNLNHVQRGALQSGTVGYWIDRERAGRSYVAEAVVVLAGFAFDELRLARLEICIVPRNLNSRRVMEKLAIREEGVARQFLEINGMREDHVRYGLTADEWFQRADELRATWLR
jgi:ribosomal-protein-alanine N-acetyltransferase